MIKITLLLLLLLASCMKTDIINEVEPQLQLDTIVMRKPHKPFPKPIEKPDTAKVPMVFSPSVTDWEVIETPTNL